MKQSNRFSKKENLKSHTDIEALFSNGRSINEFPLRVVYSVKKEKTGIASSVGVAVSKKNIKLAVQRNLIKRRIREAYRLNNHALKEVLKKSDAEVNLMIIYTGREFFTYKQIEEKIKVILSRLNALCEKGFE